MKKLIALVLTLTCVWYFAGCESAESASIIPESTAAEQKENQQTTPTQTQEAQSTEDAELPQTTAAQEKASAEIVPLPAAIDIAALEDCIVEVSLEKGDFYKDQAGTVMMDVTVFTYDLYDMAKVSLMEAGDTILLGEKCVLISTVERNGSGSVLINGGPDKGGFELYTEENTVYYERDCDGKKSYYELGNVSLPVSSDFTYSCQSDPNEEAVLFHVEDFLEDAEGIPYPFYADNTTIRIEGGYVAEMTSVYTP